MSVLRQLVDLADEGATYWTTMAERITHTQNEVKALSNQLRLLKLQAVTTAKKCQAAGDRDQASKVEALIAGRAVRELHPRSGLRAVYERIATFNDLHEDNDVLKVFYASMKPVVKTLVFSDAETFDTKLSAFHRRSRTFMHQSFHLANEALLHRKHQASIKRRVRATLCAWVGAPAPDDYPTWATVNGLLRRRQHPEPVVELPHLVEAIPMRRREGSPEPDLISPSDTTVSAPGSAFSSESESWTGSRTPTDSAGDSNPDWEPI